MTTGDHLYLIDGSAYIFRAYHALPPLTRKSDGLPVGAVAGFCNMLWKLLDEAMHPENPDRATHFAVIFDYSSKTFRNDIYPEYKANRQAPPEDLRPQFSLIRQATRAFGLPCIEAEGFEADDIIATYARLAADAGARVTIVSSDKDLMQLVNDHVSMFDPMKSRWIGPDQVIEKFAVSPQKMIDLQALAGDSTDNIPGVPGIGPKTAATLLDEYGNLENLLEHAAQIQQKKRRENLIEHAELARISKQLVSLKTDVSLESDIKDLALNDIPASELVAFLKAMEFKTITNKVAQTFEIDAQLIEPLSIEVEGYDARRGPDLDPQQQTDDSILSPAIFCETNRVEISKIPVDHDKYECITTRERLNEWVSEIQSVGRVAIDTETNSLDAMRADLVGISLAFKPGCACYIPLLHRTGNDDLLGGGLVADQLDHQTALDCLSPILKSHSILKIGQNIKYDWHILAHHGVEMECMDDTMLLSYVLDAGKNKHSMDELARTWLGHECISYNELTGSGKSKITFDFVKIDKATRYAAEDADITLRLWLVLKARLAAEQAATVYETLERPLIDVLAKMESRGIRVDRAILSRLSGELAQGAASIEAEIYKLAGESFNIASPKQMGEILFGRLGLPGGKKTKTGQYSTSAQVLEELALEGHELPKLIVFWRQLTKLKSTYTDALPNFIHPQTHRIHTSYAMASTSTGRLSSSDPNLQNIPIRTPEGRKIRTAFVAAPEHLLLSADYSQIELRVLAHIADIPQLKAAFHEGLDIHAMTASEMFDTPIKDMDPMVRRRAKAINFGIIYGISAFGLANQLSISRSEAKEYIDTYFKRFPGILDYMEETKSFAREHGYVKTIFGRKAHYPEINAKNPQHRAFNERAAINAPIQGSAADIIRRAMVRMDHALEKGGSSAQMLLQVHDELIFEIAHEEAELTQSIVTEVMENAVLPAITFSVPLKVDTNTAPNWDEAH